MMGPEITLIDGTSFKIADFEVKLTALLFVKRDAQTPVTVTHATFISLSLSLVLKIAMFEGEKVE